MYLPLSARQGGGYRWGERRVIFPPHPRSPPSKGGESGKDSRFVLDEN
jgi:hypothetical protein